MPLMSELPLIPLRHGPRKAPKAVALRGKGRPKKPRAQAYPEEIQVMLRNFLMERQEDAIKAHEAAVAILNAAPTLPGAENQLAYWKHILRAIDWLLSFVSRRQRHLTNTIFVNEQWHAR